MVQIQQSFELVREIKSVQSLVGTLRKMLSEWSRTTLSDGQLQRQQSQGSRSKCNVYHAKPSARMKEIIPLMKSIEQTGLGSPFDLGEKLILGEVLVL